MDSKMLTFERNLYQAVIKFKRDHPGVLEARTKKRNGGPTNEYTDNADPDRCGDLVGASDGNTGSGRKLAG